MSHFSACLLPSLRCTALLGIFVALASHMSPAAAQSREVVAAALTAPIAPARAKVVHKDPDQPRVKVVYRDRVVVPKPVERIIYRDRPAKPAATPVEAEAGWNDAAAMYRKGSTADDAQQYDTAKRCYTRAAELGNTDAMFKLGSMYAYGNGMEQDRVEGRAWYRKAAEAGNIKAMYYLGRMYANGLGGAQDYVQARAWYQKAADAGDTHAKQSLQNLVGK